MKLTASPAVYWLTWYFVSAPGRIRTRDPLLRRYHWRVVERRLTSLHEPSSSSYCG
jgi:hypothetical protein